MISTLDIAWAAGFLEGEGSFCSARTSPAVSAVQVQKEPLDRLQRIFGGKVYACGKAQKRGGQPYFLWSLNGARAIAVMLTVAGLMSPRRFSQIETVVSAWKSRPLGKGGAFAARTHCPQGHEYSAENTYRQSNGGRRCRACAKALRLKYPSNYPRRAV